MTIIMTKYTELQLPSRMSQKLMAIKSSNEELPFPRQALCFRVLFPIHGGGLELRVKARIEPTLRERDGSSGPLNRRSGPWRRDHLP
jgi:hypothetical protein